VVDVGRVGVEAEVCPAAFVLGFFVFGVLDFAAGDAVRFCVAVFVFGGGAPMHDDLVPDAEVEVKDGRINLGDGVGGLFRFVGVGDGDAGLAPVASATWGFACKRLTSCRASAMASLSLLFLVAVAAMASAFADSLSVAA